MPLGEHVTIKDNC